MQMDIKPIETLYHGCRFRSRLEARWAVFFDALRVPWEYEPEGFKLPSGKLYLPDFRVKCYGTRGDRDLKKPFDLYIEVKGHMTEDDASKIKEFSGITEFPDEAAPFYWQSDNPILIVGNIPSFMGSHDSWVVGAYDRMDGITIYPFNYDLIDGDCFAAYPAAHDGRFYLWGDDSSYINKDDIDAVERAYDAARQARFEHGETPNIFR